MRGEGNVVLGGQIVLPGKPLPRLIFSANDLGFELFRHLAVSKTNYVGLSLCHSKSFAALRVVQTQSILKYTGHHSVTSAKRWVGFYLIRLQLVWPQMRIFPKGRRRLDAGRDFR